MRHTDFNRPSRRMLLAGGGIGAAGLAGCVAGLGGTGARAKAFIRRDGVPVQGTNFWAWNGEARAQHPDFRYQNGDKSYMGDPMHEPQGWYGIFDSDSEMVAVIREHAQSFATA